MNGISQIISTAFYVGVGDGKAFTSGLHLSAWLGLVPGQHSTGGKPTLLGISKRGNSYLRTQFINDAKAALIHCKNRTDQGSVWVRQLKEHCNYNNATVTLANKMV